ncbi:hypothetical protein H9Y04_08515 [Streptomyces sp. TRM66268-LWL]|uniref:S1 motif domain-containing protein n=1 Tax=Streptomyces polyasparticus TaxID=2767826 RepID=A0ABR7SCZ7_9ACTN|nr:hypothetical protein [Streptomyces polyasparticus]MBC9712615.1 hypothetical protein [Streptomyces polyasparticus]
MPNSSYVCLRGVHTRGLAEYWYETGAAGGEVLRQVTFAPSGAVVCAWSRDVAQELRRGYGAFGVELYEAVYGAPDEPDTASRTEEVTVDEFEDTWRRGLIGRHFTPYDTGPVPEGAVLAGTVRALPWGAGRTGLLVDLGLPVEGFVDVLSLPREPALWPSVGTAGRFEVTTLRVDFERGAGAQIRLRPVED